MRRWLFEHLGIPLGVALLRAHASTLRITVENDGPLDELVDAKVPVLLCSWHGRFYGGISFFQRYAPAIAISLSGDGELIARLVERLGWRPVRGSSSRGGAQALGGMIAALEQGGVGGHIVDGPRGPAGQIKPGLVRIAQKTGARIVCIYIGYARAWRASSWDRFCVPLPFSRMLLRVGRPIEVPAELSREEFDSLTQQLQAEFAAEYARVDADVA